MNRAKRLIDALGLSEHEAAVVYNPSNMFYLSGYTGEGLVYISPAECAVVTDFRYTEQAEKQAPGFCVEMTEKGRTHEQIVAALCLKGGVDKLYYEDDVLTVRQFETARETIRGVEWKSMRNVPETLRQVKDPEELELIAQACKITSESFERFLPQIKEGMTEKELALLLEFDMYHHGAEKLAFSTIVAAGKNGSLPHAIPGDYKVRRGDMITFDFGAKVGGYCADMTRTVALGEPSDEMKRVYAVVLQAQQ
ncbi:MAG: Xaa-Pro peptidase family protein, partial [Eubacteriales bacterium]|nr:Xaa-Pro peptidase family protein [Eubacteriales bacterium]